MTNDMTPAELSAAERREREVEDEMAHRYDRDYHEPPVMAEHSRAFAAFVGQYVRTGDRVLDLGCASASLWDRFREELPGDISLVGVDLSPGMLEVARRKYPEGDFRVGSFAQIPSGAGEFDVVVVSSAFHHISDDLLPGSLAEIHRVLDEHGILVGREPLIAGRLGDRGGWLAAALMHLRHLTYRLTHTREYPEPDPGPEHHAYKAEEFLTAIGKVLTVVDVQFRNPASLFVARVRERGVARMAKQLDEVVHHREGQEIHYAARKNFSATEDVLRSVVLALEENQLTKEQITELLVAVAISAKELEAMFPSPERKRGAR